MGVLQYRCDGLTVLSSLMRLSICGTVSVNVGLNKSIGLRTVRTLCRDLVRGINCQKYSIIVWIYGCARDILHRSIDLSCNRPKAVL